MANKEEYNTIINTINNNVLQAIHTSLQPLWLKIEEERENYQTILAILHNMPEYKMLQTENERLKQQLQEKNKAEEIQKQMELIHTISLEVRENKPIKVDDNIDDKVKLIYLDVNLVAKENSIQTSVLAEEEEEASEAEEEEEEEEEAAESSDEEAEAEAEAEEKDEDKEEAIQAAPEKEEEAAEEEAAEAAEAEAEAEAEASESTHEEAEEGEEASEEAEAEAETSDDDTPIPTQERSANITTTVEEVVEQSEEEVFMVEIEDFGNVYTNDENNGLIYEITDDEDVGKQIGYFKDGEPIML